MKKNKLLISIIILLSVTNLGIFIFRDYFQYQLYSDYASLYGICDKKCHEKWGKTVRDYPQNEISEAKLITHSIFKLKDTSTLSKVIALGSFIYNKFKDQTGNTSAILQSISPLSQYKKLSSSDTLNLMCGQFAQIFSFFCWSEGITNRTIEIMNAGDHHVVNECYIPEKKQWLLIDLTNNQLLLQDQEKNYLNLLDFKKKIKQITPVLVWQVKNDSVKINQLDYSASFINTYYLKNNPLFYYYQTDNIKVYQLKNKIKRYFLPVTWYEIYDIHPHKNFFFIKELIFLLWLILLCFLLLRK